MKTEMKIAIAKDVLEHLDSFTAKVSNTYVQGNINFLPPSGDAQQHIETLSKKCTVCALGACFLSYIRLYDNVDMTAFKRKLVRPKTIFTSCKPSKRLFIADIIKVHANLKKVFTKTELAMMESAYERCTMGVHISPSIYLKVEAAIKFGKRYAKNIDRIRAIMENIIQNGTFLP